MTLVDLDRTREQIVASLLRERFGDPRVLALERVKTPAQRRAQDIHNGTHRGSK